MYRENIPGGDWPQVWSVSMGEIRTFCCLMSQTPHVNHQWSGEANESLVSAAGSDLLLENKAIFMHILKHVFVVFIHFWWGKTWHAMIM